MVDVFDEVEEELRQDRYRALLREYGPWAGGIAVAIVLGVAGYQFWSWQTRSVSNAASDQFMVAASHLEAGQSVEADLAFAELAESGPRGYAVLALFNRAELALQRGDRDGAIAFLNEAAQRADEPLTRDTAVYRAAVMQFEDLSFDDINLRMQPLINEGSAYGVLARELVAAAAMRDGRWDDARSRYELLAISLDAPPGLAQRAAEALSYINQNAPEADVPMTEDVTETVIETDTDAGAEDNR